MSLGLLLRAWTELLYIDVIGLGGFQAVHRVVSATPTRPIPAKPANVTAVVDAVTSACAFYIRRAQCLQRSAVVTRLLRKRGVAADLVIGCHLPPLKAHAWVEVSGDIVSDHQDGLEFYRILDRW